MPKMIILKISPRFHIMRILNWKYKLPESKRIERFEASAFSSPASFAQFVLLRSLKLSIFNMSIYYPHALPIFFSLLFLAIWSILQHPQIVDHTQKHLAHYRNWWELLCYGPNSHFYTPTVLLFFPFFALYHMMCWLSNMQCLRIN